MRITEIRMYLCREPRLKATVTVTLENAFVVKGIKVILGRQGLFLAMPSRHKDDGTYEDICHPINHETREYFESVILGEYRRLQGEDQDPDQDEDRDQDQEQGPDEDADGASRPFMPTRPKGDPLGGAANPTA